MKLLFFIDNLSSGGAQRQITNLAILFKKKGNDVSILIYNNNNNFFGKQLEQEGIKIEVLKNSNYISRIINTRIYLNKNNQDMVVSFLETPNFLACLSKIGFSKWKLITSERSGTKESFKGVKNKIFKWFERFSDAIVCNSNAAKNLWEEYYPCYSKKIFTIYNTTFIPKIDTKYEILKDGKLHIVIAASYRVIKNLINLLKALCLLSQNDLEKVQITWYGNINASDDSEQNYKDALKIIEENKLGSIIILNKAVHNIAEYMFQSDMVGLFSEYEGLPNAICEAMMLAKPVLMTPVSDYSIFITPKNGILCKSSRPESIKNALEEALNLKKENLIDMGIESKKLANNLFSSKKILENWEKIFHDGKY